MKNEQIDKLVEETLNSFEGADRATAKPFLLTRIFARMNNRPASQNIWTKAGALLSKPGIAFTGLLLVILMNVIVLVERTGKNTSNSNAGKEEINSSFVSIYEVENQEL